MKDIIIPGNRIKTELKYLLYCYIAANIVNIYAIIRYNTEWIELITWQRFVVFIAFIFYAITIILRILIWSIRKLTGATGKTQTGN